MALCAVTFFLFSVMTGAATFVGRLAVRERAEISEVNDFPSQFPGCGFYALADTCFFRCRFALVRFVLVITFPSRVLPSMSSKSSALSRIRKEDRFALSFPSRFSNAYSRRAVTHENTTRAIKLDRIG